MVHVGQGVTKKARVPPWLGSGSMVGWSLKAAVRGGLGSKVLPRCFRCSGLAALPSGSAATG